MGCATHLTSKRPINRMWALLFERFTKLTTNNRKRSGWATRCSASVTPALHVVFTPSPHVILCGRNDDDFAKTALLWKVRSVAAGFCAAVIQRKRFSINSVKWPNNWIFHAVAEERLRNWMCAPPTSWKSGGGSRWISEISAESYWLPSVWFDSASRLCKTSIPQRQLNTEKESNQGIDVDAALSAFIPRIHPQLPVRSLAASECMVQTN